MRSWNVPYGHSIRLPRGAREAGRDPRTGETLYFHDNSKRWYRVIRTRVGWRVEEWHDSEVDTEGCGEC